MTRNNLHTQGGGMATTQCMEIWTSRMQKFFTDSSQQQDERKNKFMPVKYVFVTGGVVSGLGKGITAASLGRLLKARGYKVTMQKFDP